MAKIEETRKIEAALRKPVVKQGDYGCFEVTIGIGWSVDGIVGFITYDSYGEFRF